MNSVAFYFDFASPTSYIASQVLPAITSELGATIEWRPVLLGAIFASTGATIPMEQPQKAAWMRADLARWAKRYGIQFAFSPYYPLNSLTLQRGAIAYLGGPRFNRYVEAVYHAIWVDRQDLNDPQTVEGVLTAAGFSIKEFYDLTKSEAVKTRLREITGEALSRGAFGCPTMFVGEDMFFGQDRLDFVREALLARSVADNS